MLNVQECCCKSKKDEGADVFNFGSLTAYSRSSIGKMECKDGSDGTRFYIDITHSGELDRLAFDNPMQRDRAYDDLMRGM